MLAFYWAKPRKACPSACVWNNATSFASSSAYTSPPLLEKCAVARISRGHTSVYRACGTSRRASRAAPRTPRPLLSSNNARWHAFLEDIRACTCILDEFRCAVYVRTSRTSSGMQVSRSPRGSEGVRRPECAKCEHRRRSEFRRDARTRPSSEMHAASRYRGSEGARLAWLPREHRLQHAVPGQRLVPGQSGGLVRF